MGKNPLLCQHVMALAVPTSQFGLFHASYHPFLSYTYGLADAKAHLILRRDAFKLNLFQA